MEVCSVERAKIQGLWIEVTIGGGLSERFSGERLHPAGQDPQPSSPLRFLMLALSTLWAGHRKSRVPLATHA